MSIDVDELRALPPAEKMRLVEMLWDDLGESNGAMDRQLRYHPLFDCDIREAAGWYDRRSSGFGRRLCRIGPSVRRELCAEVERATGKPTFYYMHRYWGRNVDEAVRPCPLCGGKWHSSNDSVDARLFHQFHFRCERCRLVSHCADSYDDERHARIGEVKKAS